MSDDPSIYAWRWQLSRNEIVRLQRGGVTNSIAPNTDAEKLKRDAAILAAPIDFRTPAVLRDRIWRAAKAIGHAILKSRNTGLSLEYRQSLTLKCNLKAPSRDVPN